MYDTCICDVFWTFAGEWVCPKGVSDIQVRSGIHDCMYGRYNMHFGRLWLLAVGGGWVERLPLDVSCQCVFYGRPLKPCFWRRIALKLANYFHHSLVQVAVRMDAYECRLSNQSFIFYLPRGYMYYRQD